MKKTKTSKWTIVENRVEQWETEYTVRELNISGTELEGLVYALADKVESLQETIKNRIILSEDWEKAPRGCKGIIWKWTSILKEEYSYNGYNGYISKPLPPAPLPVKKSVLALGNEYCKKIAKGDDLYSAFLSLQDHLNIGVPIEELCTSVGISLFVEEENEILH